MEVLIQDLRFALRNLVRAPGFAVVAALTLALGLGANTAIFAVVDAVMLEPLPWPEPAGKAMIWSRWKGYDRTWVNPAEARTWNERSPAIEEIAWYQGNRRNVTGDGEAVRVGSALVTANLFDTLGVQPMLGRTFTADEDRPGAAGVVMLSHALWQGRYGGDPQVLGRTLMLDGEAHQVIGVMPPGFALPTDFGEDAADPSQLWTPRQTTPEEFEDTGSHSDYAVARLAPGATAEQATREMDVAAAQLVKEGKYPAEMQFTATAVPLTEQVVGPYRTALRLLMGAVIFLTLIACANVASLLLARAEVRMREMAVRSSLGAPFGRLLRQLLTEGFVLAVAAAGVGLLFATFALQMIRASDFQIPRAVAAAVDTRAMVFAVVLAAATTLLFALAPALQALRAHLVEALKEGGARSLGSKTRQRWRSSLIIAETAFAVVLAIGAGLMARSLGNLSRIDLGLEPQGVLALSLSLPQVGYEDPAKVAGFYDAVLREVRGLPGVTQAGVIRSLPLGESIGDWGIQIEGYEPPNGMYVPGDWQVASGGAAETLGERLVQGRFIADTDIAESQQVTVVNEAFVRNYLEGREPIGVRIRQGSADRPMLTIVGVVGDVRHNGITGVVKPKFYRPIGQFHLSSGNPPRNVNLVVKTGGDPLALAGPIRSVVSRVGPSVPVANVRTMDQVVAASIAAPRFTGSLFVVFASLALVLAAIGVYGVFSGIVSRRTPEIGVRLAMGARPRDMLRLVFTEGMELGAVGIALGLALAWALSRLLTGLLHEVTPADPMTYAIVAVAIAITACVAVALPAVRASRIDPMHALREE